MVVGADLAKVRDGRGCVILGTLHQKSGKLALTGASVAVLGGVGLLTLGAGVALRRLRKI